MFESREALLSRLESVSISWSSADSNEESTFIAFRAATGDKLGLGKHMSWATRFSIAEIWDAGSVGAC
jgi:hypothetical protein